MWAPLTPAARNLEHCANWPERDRLNSLVHDRVIVSGGNQPLRLVAPQPPSEPSHPGYEARCFLSGELETREKNWHDLFNALIWLTYPLSKAALNARHYNAPKTPLAQNKRGPDRDALTLFDECGVIVASTDASLLALLKGFAWKELFWHRREDVIARMRVYLFGHGLCEQALQPFIGLTGKAVPLSIDESHLLKPLNEQLVLIDTKLAGIIGNSHGLKHPHELSPLPILGVPGWMIDNEEESFYNNTDYFRPGRKSHARDAKQSSRWIDR